jgi:glutamine synthetase
MEGMLKANIVLKKEIDTALELEEDLLTQAKAYREKVIPAMDNLREYADNIEKIADKERWPYPSYEDMLFNL